MSFEQLALPESRAAMLADELAGLPRGDRWRRIVRLSDRRLRDLVRHTRDRPDMAAIHRDAREQVIRRGAQLEVTFL